MIDVALIVDGVVVQVWRDTNPVSLSVPENGELVGFPRGGPAGYPVCGMRWNGEVLSAPPPPPPQVPAKVHKYWLIKVLDALGYMDDVEDAIDAMAAAGNRAPRRDWQAATEIERANQLVNEFAAARGWSAEQVDAMFVQATAYQAASSAA